MMIDRRRFQDLVLLLLLLLFVLLLLPTTIIATRSTTTTCNATHDDKNDKNTTTTSNATTGSTNDSTLQYNQPYYYTEQLIDHTGNNELYYNKSNVYYTQRYYQSDQYYYWNGSTTSISEKPIFVILGGEGSIEPTTGLFYPYIYKTLAQRYNAFVIEPEHRFYGTSQPISREEIDRAHAQKLPDPRIGLLTYEQAIYDMVRLLHYVTSTQLQCNVGKYTDLPPCGPVIAVGGSYPGFLSAMTRVIVPDVIDIAYAASAPIKFYSQQVHADDYYNHITTVAEHALTGCSNAVTTTLQDIYDYYSQQSIDNINTTTANELGICPNTIPVYALVNTTIFLQEIQMMIAYSFANANMGYYPPTNQTKLVQSCFIFLNNTLSSVEKVKEFYILMLGVSSGNDDNTLVCFNMTEQVPAGPGGTISGGDWSGVGWAYDGTSWDYQTCTQLIEPISLSGMIQPYRNFSYDWLQYEHCPNRFYNITIDPQYNNKNYNLNTLFDTNTSNNSNISYILFTNGLQDGWSVGGVQYNVSGTVLAINIPNGAHHSDLSRTGPNLDTDTPDVTQAYEQIQTIFDIWIHDIIQMKKERYSIVQQKQQQQQQQQEVLTQIS